MFRYEKPERSINGKGVTKILMFPYEKPERSISEPL
jgi:hypothetical protein